MAAMRTGIVWLVLLGALLIGGAAGAYYGAGKVGSHVQIEMSCKVLAAAQREGMLDARKRRTVTDAAARSAALSANGREALKRVQAGCRGVRT
ncbi:MAG: hypothetical protein HY659_00550 [Rhizobiales bacterium]|nr:hypothetical protein [Hyphomicrobiales bacterium]